MGLLFWKGRLIRQKIFDVRKKVQSEGIEANLTTSLTQVFPLWFSLFMKGLPCLARKVVYRSTARSQVKCFPHTKTFWKQSDWVILDLGLCHRGNQTRTSARAAGFSIHGTYTEIDGESMEGLENSPQSLWWESTIWASKISATRTDVRMFYPSACMVSGEQLGEK